jgi:hypothetical protein
MNDDANRDAAYEGLRQLALRAENERIRFRACEVLLTGPPKFIYQEGFVDPADLPHELVPSLTQVENGVVRMGMIDIG